MTDNEKIINRLEIQLDDLQKYADPDEMLTLTQEQAKEILALLKEQEGHVSVPFSWLVKFCTHIDFKEPMSDSEREQKWKEKLNQQFGIVV